MIQKPLQAVTLPRAHQSWLPFALVRHLWMGWAVGFLELGCLMSLLPSPGGFSQRAIVILNSTLWYLTSVLLFSSALALLASDISPKESSQCLPQGLCTCCHPHVESLSISHKTITSYRSLPKDLLLFKKEPDIRPSLMGGVSLSPLQYFGGQRL